MNILSLLKKISDDSKVRHKGVVLHGPTLFLFPTVILSEAKNLDPDKRLFASLRVTFARSLALLRKTNLAALQIV